MKKFKLISKLIILCLSIVIITILLSSCSDEIVVPPDNSYHFDNARYDWTIYQLNSSLITFESFGDSDLYMLDPGYLIQFKGSSFLNHFFAYDGMLALSMGGYDKNNVFVGGDDNTVTNYGKPRLKKWNGNLFEEIQIKDSTNRIYQISTIFSLNTNEILMGSTRGDLIHYDNGNFEFQRIDSTFIFKQFGYDNIGNLCSVAEKTVFDSSTIRYLNIYEKSKNSWQWNLVFSERYVNFDQNEIIPFQLKKNIGGFQLNIIKEFTSNGFVNIFNVEPFDVYPVNQFSDSTTDFFLLPGAIRESIHNLNLFQWNGSRWSKEINLTNLNAKFFNRVQNVNGVYFFLLTDEVLEMSYLGKGVKKNSKIY